jgi:hypothetical protein
MEDENSEEVMVCGSKCCKSCSCEAKDFEVWYVCAAISSLYHYKEIWVAFQRTGNFKGFAWPFTCAALRPPTCTEIIMVIFMPLHQQLQLYQLQTAID